MAGMVINKATKRIVKACLICGVEFIPKHNISQIYCSKECYNRHRDENSIINKLDYQTKELIRLYLLTKANGKCQHCGLVIVDKFHIHHKIKYIDGGTDKLDNLEVLCVSCHGKTHIHR